MTPTADLAREVRRLALPAIASSLLLTMVYIVDRVMLGRHGEASLAAMQVAGPLEWSLWSVFMAFEVGTIARVGRYVGARDSARAGRAARLSIGIALAAGVVVALAWPLFAPLLRIAFPDATPLVVESARDYLAWTVGSSPAVFAAAAGVAILSASGDTRTPLFAGVVANLVHIGTNRVLILGAFGVPAMGMRGAGISTSFAFVLEAVIVLGALLRRGRAVSLRRGADEAVTTRAHYAEEARQLFHVATPAFAERVLYHLGYMGFVFVLGLLGDAAMAANQSLISVEAICFLSADGFGLAAAALVAQKLGAKSPEDAGRAAGISMGYAIALLTTVGLLFLGARHLILPIFSKDAGVIAIGAAAVPVLAIAQPFMATASVLAQSLRGAGSTRVVLGVSAIGAFAVRISCTWLFAIHFRLGLTGVWIGSTCDWAVRAILLVWIASTKWRAVRRGVLAPS